MHVLASEMKDVVSTTVINGESIKIIPQWSTLAMEISICSNYNKAARQHHAAGGFGFSHSCSPVPVPSLTLQKIYVNCLGPFP
jgi:hypothetical protein